MTLTTATITGALTDLDGVAINVGAVVTLTPVPSVVLDAPGVRLGKKIVRFPEQAGPVMVPLGTYELRVSPTSSGAKGFVRIHGFVTLTADTTWAVLVGGLVQNIDLPANVVAELNARLDALESGAGTNSTSPVGIDTDGVPYFDAAGVPGGGVAVLADTDGVPYLAIGA